jgi:ABC-type branched-subunit amino acid transport system permease subunit
LLAVLIGSVSPGSYDFFYNSIPLAAIAVVMGVGSIGAAAVGGIFLVWGRELLHVTHINVQYFPLIIGALLIAQLVLSPQGFVVKLEHDVGKVLGLFRRGGKTEPVAEVL